MKNKIAIIGCGQSGTRYTSKVLTAFGLDIGHEKDGDNGTVDWTATMRELDGYDCIFHQVRRPLEVIASCHGIKATSWDLIKRAGIIEQDDSKIIKSMKYWLYWNTAAQERAIFTYQVESLEEAMPRIFEHMGWGYNPHYFNKVKNIGKKGHTSSDKPCYPDLTWESLREADERLAMRIALLAKSYGYFARKTVKEIENWNI